MRTTKQRSKATKITVFLVLVGVVSVSVIGLSIAATNKSKQEAAADTVQKVATAESSTNQTAVLGEQTTNTQSYVVTVNKVLQTNKILSIGITITNESKETLQTSPFIQFRLVSQTANTAHTPILPSGAQLYSGGPLVAGASNSGTIYFDAFAANDQYELRFYTDPATSTDYIVVPLIASTN